MLARQQNTHSPLSNIQTAVVLLFWAILPTLGLYFYHFQLLWPFSDGCIFIVFGHFGQFWTAVGYVPEDTSITDDSTKAQGDKQGTGRGRGE